ncbi:lipid II flippase MurJ [Chromobacterium haemolyticum]|uniref:lipid II flippase MurJ n=1 Tax=Chromobacterium TaxID=535 RepID=UPI0040563F3B
MFGPAALLTLATLAGLLAGFAREWLLVAAWGAGGRSDAFLVAMFLPEALRTLLAGGLLSAALLPLWQAQTPARRGAWLAGQLRHWLGVGLGLAALFSLAAPWLTRALAPGVDAAHAAQAAAALRWLAWLAPGLLLQAALAAPLQAQGRFLLAGLGSLLFNLPAVSYLYWAGPAAEAATLAQCFLVGSLLMAAALLPGNWRLGWRPWLRAGRGEAGQAWRQLWPLLASGAASQGLGLLERVAASLLGEGTITLLNLARKLINLPLIALMSLNQVLLSKMSGALGADRLRLLDSGLAACTLLTLPAAAGLIGAAPALVALLLPAGLAASSLPLLLALYAPGIVFGAWNALLARYCYAGGDTRGPMLLELAGSALSAALLLTLPRWLGLPGLALAALAGVWLTGGLLAARLGQGLLPRLVRQGLTASVPLAPAGLLLFPLRGFGPWPQLALAAVAGAVLLLVLGWRFRAGSKSREQERGKAKTAEEAESTRSA